jgi:hypothetical protein
VTVTPQIISLKRFAHVDPLRQANRFRVNDRARPRLELVTLRILPYALRCGATRCRSSVSRAGDFGDLARISGRDLRKTAAVGQAHETDGLSEGNEGLDGSFWPFGVVDQIDVGKGRRHEAFSFLCRILFSQRED